MAKVTIEGTPSQIATIIRSPRMQAIETGKRRREEITAKRKIVREAFELIRRNPEEAVAIDRLAGTLGGRYPMNQDALDLAAKIIETYADR